jgi:hypothetical protein
MTSNSVESSVFKATRPALSMYLAHILNLLEAGKVAMAKVGAFALGIVTCFPAKLIQEWTVVVTGVV